MLLILRRSDALLKLGAQKDFSITQACYQSYLSSPTSHSLAKMFAEVEDDDMIVVVIKEEYGRDDNNQQEVDDMMIDEVTGEMISTKHIKQEICNETFDVELYNVLQKYGTPIKPQTLIKKIVDDDSHDSDYLPEEKHEDSDEEFNVKKQNTPIENKQKTHPHRSKLLAPHEARSTIDELRQLYPKFADDQDALILHLAKMMKSVKPPPPPDGYCIYINAKSYECATCQKITDTKAASERHYAEKHGPRYLNCFSCGVDFRCLLNLYKHEKRCLHPDAEIVLRARAICVGLKGSNRPFLTTYQKSITLSKKQKEQKQSQSFQCGICGAIFRSRRSLSAHELLHTGVRPFKCEQCAVSYTNKHRLERHLQLHAGVRYECDICGRVYPIKSSLATHMESHSERRLVCPYECGKKYASNYALRIHIDGKHRDKPPPCACNICPKRFFKMSLLKVHMKKEHGLLLMTRNMLIKQLPKMDPDRIKAMFGDVAAYVHNGKSDNDILNTREIEGAVSDDLNISSMESAQFDVDQTVTSDQSTTHDMPHVDNQDLNVVTTDLALSNGVSQEFILSTNNPGFTINIDQLGKIQIKKENYEVSSQEILVNEVLETDDLNINSHGERVTNEILYTNNGYDLNNSDSVVLEQEAYRVPVCQDISLEEVLKSNKKFKVVMINK